MLVNRSHRSLLIQNANTWNDAIHTYFLSIFHLLKTVFSYNLYRLWFLIPQLLQGLP